jgi:uncharacterized membrane protein
MDFEFLPFILLILAIPMAGVAGFFMALSLRSRTAALEGRLTLVESRLEPLAAAARRAAAAGVVRDARAAPEAPPVAEAPPLAEVPSCRGDAPHGRGSARGGGVLPGGTRSGARRTRRPTRSVPPVPHAPPRPRKAGLEEQLGTRWAVWVGGLALALGGLFLVRYSIEQGCWAPAPA